MTGVSNTLRSVGAAAVLLVVSGCAAGSSGLCDAPVSMAGFVVNFDQQLDNFDSDQSAGLQPETMLVLDQARLLADDASLDDAQRTAARSFVSLVDRFADAMDDVLWDVPTAMADARTTELVVELGSAATLEKANLLESVVITRCGLPPLIPTDTGVVPTLPMPSIPSPTATDPPTNTVNEESEARALGTTVGELFALTLDDADTVCLGRALSGVYDATGGASTVDQYQRQFQSAFDRCEIDFTVPES